MSRRYQVNNDCNDNGFVPRHWQELRFDQVTLTDEQLRFRASIDALIGEYAPEVYDRERMADRKLMLSLNALIDNALAQDGITIASLSRRDIHSLIVVLMPITSTLLDLAGVSEASDTLVVAGSLRQKDAPRRERLIIAEMAYHYSMAWRYPHAKSGMDILRGIGRPKTQRHPGREIAELQSLLLNQIANAWVLICDRLRRILDAGQRDEADAQLPDGAELGRYPK